jgi:hypothetical protein
MGVESRTRDHYWDVPLPDQSVPQAWQNICECLSLGNLEK